MTLADVAAHARVSLATASRALAGDRRITAATREAVRAAADELHYIPNVAARNLRAQRTRTLGLLLSDLADPDHARVGAGFENEAAASGYTVFIVAARKVVDAERRAMIAFKEQNTDGICIASASLPLDEAQHIAGSVPLTIVQPDHPSVASEHFRLPDGAIRTDDTSGTEQSVRHLIARGYRDIAYLGAGMGATNLLRRAAAVRMLQEELGRSMRTFEVGDETWRDPAALTEALGPVLPEAVICYDDKMALALLDGLRAGGVRVPEDVAVTGYDGVAFAAFSNPRLTTVVTPAAEMGQLAAVTLVQAIETGTLAAPRVLPVELVIRESSMAANRGHTEAVPALGVGCG